MASKGKEKRDKKESLEERRKRLVRERRSHLDERLRNLYHRAEALEKELMELDTRFYRVCIFGSARIQPDMEEYQEVFDLARLLASEGIDILTGGGPGLMEAANKGAQLGTRESNSKSRSFGLSIQLEFEPKPNKHLDVKRHHNKFSSRLDDFMRLSHSVVATPGGIGTVLEVFFTWQLIQVKHLPPRPIVLMDESFWSGIMQWMRDVPLSRGLVGERDFDNISIVDTPRETAAIISRHYREFLEKQKSLKK